MVDELLYAGRLGTFLQNGNSLDNWQNSQDQEKTYRAELELQARTGHGRWEFLTMGHGLVESRGRPADLAKRSWALARGWRSTRSGGLTMRSTRARLPGLARRRGSSQRRQDAGLAAAGQGNGGQEQMGTGGSGHGGAGSDRRRDGGDQQRSLGRHPWRC